MTAAPTVTGFSEKTVSFSEKNGLSENPVTVKQSVTTAGTDPQRIRSGDGQDPDRHRILLLVYFNWTVAGGWSGWWPVMAAGAGGVDDGEDASVRRWRCG